MLREILGLSAAPVLRPAQIVGYKICPWGKYPAVVDKSYGVVKGWMFDVPDEASAAKLASYETKNYEPAPCLIDLIDGDHQEQVNGYVFKYCGNPKDLTERDFDLDRWLQLMGRRSRRDGS